MIGSLIVPVALLSGQTGSAVDSAFSAIRAAHSRMSTLEATLLRPKAAPVLIAKNGGVLTVRVTATFGEPLSRTRTFRSDGRTATLYDDLLNETLRIPVLGKGAFPGLSSVLGGADPGIAYLLEPGALASTLNGFAKRSGWKMTPGHLVWKSGKSSADLRFDPVRHLLTRVITQDERIRTDLGFVYKANGLNAWNLPVTGRSVRSLTSLAGAMELKSSSAAAVVRRVLRAAGRLNGKSVFVKTENGDFRVDFGANGGFRQVGPKLEITLVGQTLSIKERRTGKLYRGQVTSARVRGYALQMGEALLPISSAASRRALPFANVFFPRREVRVKGQLSVGGVPQTILSLESGSTRTTLFVTAGGAISSLEFVASDPAGQALQQERQSFRYTPLQGGIALPKGNATPLK